MKETESIYAERDILDNAILRIVEAGDVVFGTIGEAIKNVDRLQRLRKGGS